MKKILLISILVIVNNYLSSQTLQWVKNTGSVNSQSYMGSTMDASGSIYTSGYYYGVADFDPGAAVYNLTSAGLQDIFVSKLDNNGNFAWVKSMGGTQYESAEGITCDGAGNVYTTGYFQGVADFDPGAGVFNLVSIGGAYTAFISKLDSNGNFVWAKSLNGGQGTSARGICTDASGNVYIAGGLYGTADFDPGPGIYTLTGTGITDLFVCKFDSNGNFVWAKNVGGANSTFIPISMTVDTWGNIYTTGRYTTGPNNDSADFDPGGGIYNLSSAAGSEDIFISKLDNNGNFVLAQSIGSAADEEIGMSIATDDTGNIYTMGIYMSTADFDAGAAVYNLTSSGSRDIFILKSDSNGNFIWAKSIGGPNNEGPRTMILDDSGYVYMTGFFRNTVDFDPGAGVFNLTSNGWSDIFVCKLDINGDFAWTKSMGGGGGDGGTYITLDTAGYLYVCGTFQLTADFEPSAGVYNLTAIGVNDNFVMKLKQCDNASYSSFADTACYNYTWNGQTYTASGIYTHTIANAGGCDSVISLFLTINNSVTSTDTISACNSYTWIDNLTYTANNNMATYTFPGGAASGCDSIVTLNLTINLGVDTSVTQLGITLSANATGATYQWIDCNNNNMPIMGDTNQNHLAFGSGSYAVIVSKGGCSDTSSCYTLITFGIDGVENNFPAVIYPNPASSMLTIECNEKIDEVFIYNMVGTLVQKETKNNFPIKELSKGNYIVKIKTNKGSRVGRLVKE